MTEFSKYGLFLRESLTIFLAGSLNAGCFVLAAAFTFIFSGVSNTRASSGA